MALAEYNDVYWFPDGSLARNTPARVFPEHSNTFAQLYADEAGTQPLPNPLNTGDDGRLRFWAEAGIYWISIDHESIRVGVGVGEEGITPQQVDEKIAAHAADTTDVHGIPDTSQLATRADLDPYATDTDLALVQGDLDAHTAATTGVHGIADTGALETQAGAQAKADAARDAAVTTAAADATGKLNAARGELEEQIAQGDAAQAAALDTHAAQTTNVHGIPDTATIPTDAQFQEVRAALDTHAADTTAVHGIADTSQLATTGDVNAVNSALTGHVQDTTGVHGIADTSQLLTAADMEQYATDAELTAHTGATTNVHGIADTAELVTSADLAGMASDAEVAAVQGNLDTHAAATTGVHGIADTSQLLTQGDLAGTVDQAQFDAHTAATTAVHGIADTASLLTQQDLDQYATDAELAAHTGATTGVHGIADTAALVTSADLAGMATDADVAAVQGNLDTHAAATTGVHGIADTSQLLTQGDLAGTVDQAQFDAHVAATTAVHGITDTAELLTTGDLEPYATDADLTAHAADTTAVHGIADTTALETKTGAQAKADAARDAAIANAANTYLNRTTGGTVEGNVTFKGYLETFEGTVQHLLPVTTAIAQASQVTGEAYGRYRMEADGKMQWGSGTADRDTTLRRSGAGQLTLDGSLVTTGGVRSTGVGERLFVRRTSNLSRANNATESADTQLRVTLQPNAVYELRGFLLWGNSSTGNIKFGFEIPTGADNNWVTYQPAPAVTGEPAPLRYISTNGAGVRAYGWHGGTTPAGAILSGLVVTGATGGTYALTWAQATANATATIMYANSYMVLTRME